MSSDGGFHCPPKYRSRARESTGSWIGRGSLPNLREIRPNPAGSAARRGFDFFVTVGQRSQGGFGKLSCGPARQPAGFCVVFDGRAQRPAGFCAFWRRPPQQPGRLGEFFRHWLRGQTPSCDFCPGWLPRPSQTGPGGAGCNHGPHRKKSISSTGRGSRSFLANFWLTGRNSWAGWAVM